MFFDITNDSICFLTSNFWELVYIWVQNFHSNKWLLTNNPLDFFQFHINLKMNFDQILFILGYYVEKRSKGGDWVRTSNFPVNDTKLTVMNLNEGQVLEFRVVAVNDSGPGKPSKPTKPHTVKDPICKWCIVFICFQEVIYLFLY